MNLSRLFNPKTIAVVGASADSKSVGYGLFKNLVGGCVYKCKRCAAFTGKVYPINPNHKEILGIKAYPDLSSVKERIDLAIIAVPARIVPAIARQCALKKVGGVIIISAGFAESGAEGAKLQDETVEALKGIPMIGPNCLGILIPQEHLKASFAP